ncbi:MAG: hypothetical protein QM731_01525 [Chitinophagaceae bacterium]
MKIWYNPALKTDKNSFAHALFRSVQYPGMLSYSSKSATLELVFINADEESNDNLPYASLSIGINADNSNKSFMSASSAMLGFSYALPLNYNNTYISIGIQGNYSFNKIGNPDYNFDLADNFDRYGAIGWAQKRDPFSAGYNYKYFTIGAGTAVFHSEKDNHWYAGISARHFNHPYTEWTRTSVLQTAYGVQGGYRKAISENAQLSFFCNVSWQKNDTVSVTQQHYGISYIRYFRATDSTGTSVTAGIGISPGESVKPALGLEFGKDRFGFCYEFNLPGIASGGYSRRGYIITYRRRL